MDKSRQEKRELRRKQEDAQFNKLLIWVAAALVFEAVVLFIKRFLVNYGQTNVTELRIAIAISKMLMVLQYVAPILMVAAAVWCLIRFKKNAGIKLPAILCGVFAALTVTAVLGYNFRAAGMTIVCALPPVVAVLALIYYIYQKEFFFSTVLGILGIFALWFYRKAYAVRPLMVVVLCCAVLIVLAVAAFLLWKLSKQDGKWKETQLFAHGISYKPAFISVGVTALAVLAALAVGATVAYYAIFALIVWLFCLVVYYTVRMM